MGFLISGEICVFGIFKPSSVGIYVGAHSFYDVEPIHWLVGDGEVAHHSVYLIFIAIVLQQEIRAYCICSIEAVYLFTAIVEKTISIIGIIEIIHLVNRYVARCLQHVVIY